MAMPFVFGKAKQPSESQMIYIDNGMTCLKEDPVLFNAPYDANLSSTSKRLCEGLKLLVNSDTGFLSVSPRTAAFLGSLPS